MKKYVAILLLMVINSYICSAQGYKTTNNSKVEHVKVLYFTRSLSLTPSESKNFWSVYNEYYSKIKQAWKIDINNRQKFDEETAAIKDNYRPVFVKVLNSHERANDVFKVEKQYRAMLKEALKKRQKDNIDK